MRGPEKENSHVTNTWFKSPTWQHTVIDGATRCTTGSNVHARAIGKPFCWRDLSGLARTEAGRSNINVLHAVDGELLNALHGPRPLRRQEDHEQPPHHLEHLL